MKNALVLVAATILAVLHNSLALTLTCPSTPVYREALIESKLCLGNDMKYLWPNYKNPSQYFRCQGEGNYVLESCPPYALFDFTNQKCSRCAQYTPVRECKALKTKDYCESFTPAVVEPEPAPICSTVFPTYTQTFRPKCVGIDTKIYWPNYDKLTEYYWCQGEYNPKIVKCPNGYYFDFYKQLCVDCFSYTAAPECAKLPFDKSNKCQKIGSLPPLTEIKPDTQTCFELMNFKEKLTPLCLNNNKHVKWPNYENFAQYYLCFDDQAKLVDCPYNSYFSFVDQRCTRCDKFVPPPECKKLAPQAGTCAPLTDAPTTKPPATPAPVCPSASNYKANYKSKLTLTCDDKELNRFWPNYEDATKYNKCDGPYNPITVACPANRYFNFYTQLCEDCNSFLRAPNCENLQPKSTTRKCVKI